MTNTKTPQADGEGFVLVPREPTHEMEYALAMALDSGDYTISQCLQIANEAAPAIAPTGDDAQQAFATWFCLNYPGPHTIISDPNWHAPRIFRQAQWALRNALPAAGNAVDASRVFMRMAPYLRIDADLAEVKRVITNTLLYAARPAAPAAPQDGEADQPAAGDYTHEPSLTLDENIVLKQAATIDRLSQQLAATIAEKERAEVAAQHWMGRTEQAIAERDRDAARLDWLEQFDNEDACVPLIIDWKWGGKRYPGGLRDAIDAAIAAGGEETDHG